MYHGEESYELNGAAVMDVARGRMVQRDFLEDDTNEIKWKIRIHRRTDATFCVQLFVITMLWSTRWMVLFVLESDSAPRRTHCVHYNPRQENQYYNNFDRADSTAVYCFSNAAVICCAFVDTFGRLYII